MLGLTLKMAKQNFFDRAKVIEAVDEGTRKVLSKFGAFVRQRAKTSIRYRDRAGLPGQPPSAHRTMMRRKTNRRTGASKAQAVSPLREFILFAYDSGSRSVVIGPALLKAGSRAPALLEYGGTASVLDPRTGRRKRATYRARPYMRPAFDAELSSLPDLWKNSVVARR